MRIAAPGLTIAKNITGRPNGAGCDEIQILEMWMRGLALTDPTNGNIGSKAESRKLSCVKPRHKNIKYLNLFVWWRVDPIVGDEYSRCFMSFPGISDLPREKCCSGAVMLKEKKLLDGIIG